MKKKAASTKGKRTDAEKAGEHYLRSLGCLCTRRPVRTQFQSIDFFGSDVVGKLRDGSHIYAQVTTGKAEAARVRRRKLEAYPWHASDRVLLLQLAVDAETRPYRWYFRVHEYKLPVRQIDTPVAQSERRWDNSSFEIDVPRAWFKAWKEETKDG